MIIRKDGAILFQLRDDKAEIAYPNYWGIPMGRVEDGEDYKKAAIRELTEETDYIPEDIEELATLEVDHYWEGKLQHHIYWTMYDGEQTINCNEGQEMRFLQLDELLRGNYQPKHDELFKLAVEKAREHGLLKPE